MNASEGIAVFDTLAARTREAGRIFEIAGRSFEAIASVYRSRLYDAYRAEGAYYGDSDEGFERWCDQRLLLDLLGYDYPTGRMAPMREAGDG